MCLASLFRLCSLQYSSFERKEKKKIVTFKGKVNKLFTSELCEPKKVQSMVIQQNASSCGSNVTFSDIIWTLVE